jgi:flagella basal body P-ring formation protein FlgA
VLAVTILAWATQTLVQQWGFGAELPPLAMAQNQTAERFVPREGVAPVRLELRGEAAVIGDEVALRQVARWSDADADTFAPVADLVLLRLSRETPFKSITLDEIKATLRDAGVNLAGIRFTGAARCVIHRVDVEHDESRALDQWIAARTGVASSTGLESVSATQTEPQPVDPDGLATDANLSTPAEVHAAGDAGDDVRSLRSLLLNELARRTGFSRAALQVSFKPGDEKLLNLSQPQFRFTVDSGRARSLGDVSWVVTIAGADGSKQRVSISAFARAWQHQLVAARPIAAKQTIRDEDVTERRTLVDRGGDEPMLRSTQAIGQQAARDIAADAIITPRMLEAVPLVRPGQFVTVTLSQGGVQVKTVARALEGGAYGQTIRVRNETTRDVFQVVVTAPQTATIGGAGF